MPINFHQLSQPQPEIMHPILIVFVYHWLVRSKGYKTKQTFFLLAPTAVYIPFSHVVYHLYLTSSFLESISNS